MIYVTREGVEVRTFERIELHGDRCYMREAQCMHTELRVVKQSSLVQSERLGGHVVRKDGVDGNDAGKMHCETFADSA